MEDFSDYFKENLLDLLNCNLIVKLHHYMHFYIKKIFANPNKNANVKIEQTINELLNNHGQAN